MPKSKKRRIRIVSDDGVVALTKVLDADTGEEIPRIFRIELDIDARLRENESGRIRGILHTWMPAVDVVAEVQHIDHCPYCVHDMSPTERTEEEYGE